MRAFEVELTDDERQLLDRIEFDSHKIEGGVKAVEAVCDAARELALSLASRKAIPERAPAVFQRPRIQRRRAWILA